MNARASAQSTTSKTLWPAGGHWSIRVVRSVASKRRAAAALEQLPPFEDWKAKTPRSEAAIASYWLLIASLLSIASKGAISKVILTPTRDGGRRRRE